MNSDEIILYKQQLQQINLVLQSCLEGSEKQELLTLKKNIEELLVLTNETEQEQSILSLAHDDPLSDEYALFMAEMEEEGVMADQNDSVKEQLENLKDIEGMKCRAPHKHQWGSIAYHNAMVCSVVSGTIHDEIMVRVLFINPTHQEMLPCPYYYGSDCKFTEEKCKYSHGEVVSYSSLQQYNEPKFNLLTRGSSILAKQSNNLWYRAIVMNIYEGKCLVKFEYKQKEAEVLLKDIFPLTGDSETSELLTSDDDSDKIKHELIENEDIIHMNLLVTPSTPVLGDWEKYTKGIGLKLMQKMGYIIGTGLGKHSEGRIEPVTAVILPQGKSLDHCMNLREKAGNHKDLFSAERKLKQLQKRQKMKNRKAYEKQLNKVDVFSFINTTISGSSSGNRKDKLDEKQKIKKECSKSLNIKSLQIADNIKKVERDLEKLKDSLSRHTDVTSNIHLKLKDKLVYRQDQLKMYQTQALIIRNEQSLRTNKKKMTVF